MNVPDAAASAAHRTVQLIDRVRVRLGWRWSGMAALGAALAALAGAVIVLIAVSQDVISSDGLEVHDPTNLALFTDHRTPSLIEAAKLLTNLGSAALLIPTAILTGVALWLHGARLIVAAAPALALGVAGALAGLGKVLIGRTRPPTALHLVTETDASFPSGHSTDSAALYLTVGLVLAVIVFHRPVARVLSVAAGLAVAGIIGLSRLELGVHWPTDVIVGWALGTTTALAVTTLTVLIAGSHPPETQPGASRRARARWRLHQLAVCRHSTLSASGADRLCAVARHIGPYPSSGALLAWATPTVDAMGLATDGRRGGRARRARLGTVEVVASKVPR